ncbi:MAG: DHA2 family efflux MFS transporter permease subunit [Gammaproteobacteria bacterium]
MQGKALLAGAIAVSSSVFMCVQDTTNANVSIPSIAGDLGASPNQGTLVITAFAVANAIAMPLTGWLAQRVGQVKLFVASLLLFVFASAACGSATSLEALIFARAVQGAVAAPLLPMSQSLMLSIFPREKAGIGMSAWSTTALVAPVLGPILGGWISEDYAWPWIFYINVPVGLAAAWAAWMLLRDRETPTRRSPVDLVGLSLLVIWVGSLQIMLDTGREHDWFGSPFIVGLAITAAVGLIYFIAWELTDPHPVVDLRLFRRRSFAMGTIALSIGHGAFFGNMVVLPLWLQTQLGYSPSQAGMVLAPIGLFAVFLAPLVGRGVQRVDARWFPTLAFLVFAGVLYLRSLYTASVDTWHLLLPSYVQGIAMATYFAPLTLISLSGVPPERMPAAAGLSNFIRTLGLGFGTSIATTVWSVRATVHHAQLVENASDYSPQFGRGIETLEDAGLATTQAYGAFERMLSLQAGVLGANDVFRITAILFLALLVLVWLARPSKG